MHRRNASIRNILRSLKQPTKLDAITDAIPKPDGAVPSFGLPRWKVMPLESKLPLVPAPSGTYYFSRKKIGQELFIDSRKDAAFNLNDPYNYDIDYSYDPLHDEHLVDYFAKKNKMKHMIQRGFITKNLDVICSVKQYNTYRKYLKKLCGDSIKKELRREAEIHEDRRVLSMAEKEAAKDLMRMKVREEKMAFKNKIYQESIRQEKLKRKKREKEAARVEERLKRIELNKKENIKKIMLKAKLHAEDVKRKRAMMKYKERQKVVNILLKRAKRERKRKKMKQERILEERECNQRINEDKWQQKCQFQEMQLKTEKLVLDYAKQQRNQFIDNYRKKVDAERERIKDEISKTAKFKKCYAARHAGGARKICCNIPKKDHVSKGTKKQSRSIDDLCLTTDICNCDESGKEYCEDQQHL